MNALKEGWQVIKDPKGAYKGYRKQTFEDVLGTYMKLLLLSGALAGLRAFVFAFSRAGYLDVVRGVGVDYWRLANYYAGIGMGTFFFYIFAGTFIFFIIVLLLRVFMRKRTFTEFTGIACMAMTPILLFSWIDPRFVAPLGIWAVTLFITGREHA